MNFFLSDSEKEKASAFIKEQNLKSVEIQKSTIEFPNEVYEYYWSQGYPYTGAIGGSLSYSFTPTSIMTIVVVTHLVTGETLDVTDYDNV